MNFDEILAKLTTIFIQKGFDEKQSTEYATDLMQQALLRLFANVLEAKIPEIEQLDPKSSLDEIRAQLKKFHQPEVEQMFLTALQETMDAYVAGVTRY